MINFNFIKPNKLINFLKSFYIFIVLFLIYIPIIFIFILSFTGQTDKGNLPLNFNKFVMVNYLNLFRNNEFLNSFLNSFLVAIIVSPVSILIAIFACIGMWYSRHKSKKIILTLTKTNIALPDILTGIMLAILFFSTWVSLGFNLGYFTVVLSHISFCTPYAIVAIYPKMTKMKINLFNASLDLGYSKLSTYFKFVIPFLKSSIITAFIIVTTTSFDDFIITSLVNGNFQTIGTEIFQSRKGIKAWIVTFGAILVIIMLIIIIIFSIYKYIKIKRSKNVKKN
ncbi:MAG: ABC transporter permease [Mycoplasmoidaceae bacterium]